MSVENMDVDHPPSSSEVEQEVVLVHPLAVVNMSDHYTRITCGGSPLPRAAPVVGLLFGQYNNNDNNEHHKTLHILDSSDIPPQQQQQQQQHETQTTTTPHPGVALHHAVFPQHEVVGWYRVVGTTTTTTTTTATATQQQQPTAEDLAISLQLQQQYKANIFCLLQAPSLGICSKQQKMNKNYSKGSSSSSSRGGAPHQGDFSSDKKPAAKGDDNNNDDKNNVDDEEEDDEEQALPLTLYCVAPNQKSLLAVEQWSLQSFPAERIATEHVIRSSSSSSSSSTNNNGKNGNNNNNSPFLEQMHHLQESWQTLSQKIQVLQDYLQDVATGALPHHPSLLRQVHQVLLGWPLAPPSSSSWSSSSSSSPQQQTTTTTIHSSPSVSIGNMMQQLAILTKTVDAVSSYTTKFRAVHEASANNNNNNNNTSSSGMTSASRRGRHQQQHARHSSHTKQRQQPYHAALPSHAVP